MSYQIGQFRKTQLDSYFTPLEMELDYQQTTVNEGIVFQNAVGKLSGQNIVNNQNCYYLRFGVKQRNDSQQIFSLKLQNSLETNDNEQFIEEYKVSRGKEIIYFEVIISPNSTYDQIVWELQRTSLDYRLSNSDGSNGRIMSVTMETYARLIDILTILKSTYPQMEYLTKIGIQGPPSLLMCINREQIRIGKTGIYEINNGINITSISFVPKESILNSNNLDYFIMDFEY